MPTHHAPPRPQRGLPDRSPGCRGACLTLVLGLLLAACGGGGDPAPEPPPPAPTQVAAGQSTSQALGVAGGTVLLATTEGVRVELAVPDGALSAAATVGISTASASTAQRLHLRFAPAGTVLEKPATVTLTLPPSMALPAGGTLTYDGVPLPTTRLADGRLQVQIARFAAPPATAAGFGAADGRRRALAAPPSPPCGGLPEFAEGGMTARTAADVELYGACMVGAVNALAVTGQYEQAAQLATATAAYLQSTGSGDAARFLNEARTLACTAYGLALDDAAATTVTSFATLSRAVKPVLFWEAAVQRLGAVCSGIAPTRYVSVVENLTSDALRFYASRQGAVVDVGSVEYTEAVQEARDGEQAVAQVQSLEPPAPVRALAQAQIEERAQPALVDAVLQAPWQRCRDSGQYDELIRLISNAGELGSVLKAAQYCGTRLQAVGRLSSGEVSETLAPALGGERAGSSTTRGSLYVPRNGRLELSGAIAALGCPSGRSGGSEGLSVRIAGVEVRRLEAPYLGSPVFIEMAPALATAGVAEAAFEAPLTIERVGSPCAGFWGDNPAPLLQLDLSFNNDLRVTVFRTRDTCNVLVDPTPPVSDAKYLRSDVTDESSPQSLPLDRRVNCGPRDWTATQQLRRVDARTLRWQQDARWLFSWYDLGPFARYGEGSIGQWMHYNVQFARAGRVTVTFEQTAGSCRYNEDSGVGVYALTLVRSGLEKAVSSCVTAFGAEPTSSISFDVVAGHTQSFLSRFEAFAYVESDTLIREHASSVTIRFEPAP